MIEKYDTPKKRLDALREMYAQFARNRRLALLSLEFKLYAIRHPRAQARLRAWNRKTQCSKKEMLERIAPAIGGNLSASGPAISTALGAFSHALLLEHLVDPAAMPSDEIQELLKSLFETVVAPRGR